MTHTDQCLYSHQPSVLYREDLAGRATRCLQEEKEDPGQVYSNT